MANFFFQITCCGPGRPFNLALHDSDDKIVLYIKRPLRCCCCCFPCCLQNLEVYAGKGLQLIGTIKQNWHPLFPKFTLANEFGTSLAVVKGPFCTCACCSDVNFPVSFYDSDF